MMRLILYLWNSLVSYAGANILDIITLSVILFGGYKLFTNHLHHIKLDIKSLSKTQNTFKKAVSAKLINISTLIRDLQELTNTRGAICEERHKKEVK